MRMADVKHITTIVLPPSLVAALDAEARTENRSRSNYIQWLLEHRHDHWASGAEKNKKDKK
jgi:hypothetical protein